MFQPKQFASFGYSLTSSSQFIWLNKFDETNKQNELNHCYSLKKGFSFFLLILKTTSMNMFCSHFFISTNLTKKKICWWKKITFEKKCLLSTRHPHIFKCMQRSKNRTSTPNLLKRVKILKKSKTFVVTEYLRSAGAAILIGDPWGAKATYKKKT